MNYDTGSIRSYNRQQTGTARQPSLLCVYDVFDGTFAPLFCDLFGFLGLRGLEVGRFTMPFLKCVSSNLSK